MNVLITGGTGLLGKSLIETRDDAFTIVATYIGNYEVQNSSPDVSYRKLDVLNYEEHREIFESFKPDVVIHAASIGSPDFAEQNKEVTWSINVTGTSNIVDLCRKFHSRLIFISSNGIYDGDHAPYDEAAKAIPVNYYGQTKLEGEILAKTLDANCTVVRPILMYGWNNSFERGNIVTMIIDKLKNGRQMNVYDDVFSNPLYSIHCAEAIWKIIRENRQGAYNIAGADRLSVYGLALKVAEAFGLDRELVKPVRQGFFNELVKRPKDTSYVTDRMERELAMRPLGIGEGLTLMKKAAPQ